MADWDFTKDPTPEDIQTFITYNKGGKDGKDFTPEDVKQFWTGQRTLLTRQKTMAEGGPGYVGQFKRWAGQESRARTTRALREAPGLVESFGATPEGVGKGVGEVVQGLMPGTYGEAAADALLLGRGFATRAGRLGPRLATGLTQPVIAGAGQAALDVATGERTPGEAAAQGAFRAVAQAPGDILGSLSTKGLGKLSAEEVGALVEPMFPNTGRSSELAAIAGEITKARRVYPQPGGGTISRSLDDLERVVTSSLAPFSGRPGYLTVPEGTGVKTITVNRPAVGVPPGLTGAPGAGQVPFKIAAAEDVIAEIRHLRGQIRKALETTDPLASENLLKWRQQRTDLQDALISQLTPEGRRAWNEFDDLTRKSLAMRDLLQVGGTFGPKGGLDLMAIQEALTNFKAGKTPLMKKLEDAGLLEETLDVLYREPGGGLKKLGTKDVAYGPLRVFSMLAGTGAAGGVPIGKVTSRVGQIPGAFPAIAAGTTSELGRLGREYMSSPSLIGSPEVQ